MKNLWLILGAAAAVFFIGRSRLARRIEFILRGVSVRGSVLQPLINLDVIIQNPTAQRATLRSITGQMLVNGRFVANISFFGTTIIQPTGETIVSINARPSITGAFSAVRDILTGQSGSNIVSVVGSSNIDGITYPVNIETTV